jgi:hypothetical protein
MAGPEHELTSPGPVEKHLIKRTKKGPILAALIDPEDFTPSQAAEVSARAIDAAR